MKRIDLVKLRKFAGMSQRQLATLLQVRPSFLSAIENGRSRLPEEKVEKIKEIFELDDLSAFMTRDEVEVPPHTHEPSGQDSLTHLLTHIHDLAHKNDRARTDSGSEFEERIDFLTRRNDRLSTRVDDLRDEVDNLRSENLRLKELLVRNGIQYQ